MHTTVCSGSNGTTFWVFKMNQKNSIEWEKSNTKIYLSKQTLEGSLEGLANTNVLTVHLLKFHFALACSAVGICPAQIKEGIKIFTSHFSMRHVVGSYV